MQGLTAACFLAALVVSACSAGHLQTQQTQTSYAFVIDSNPRVVVKSTAAVRRMVDRLQETCVSAEQAPLQIPQSYFQPSLRNPGDVTQCVRARIATAVAEPMRLAVCESATGLEEFALCLLQGAYQNRLRASVGSPSELSEQEWRNNPFAVSNTTSAIVAKAYSRCTTGGREEMEQCQVRVTVESLGLSEAETASCIAYGVVRANCLADQSTARFIDDVTMLIW